MSTQSQLRFVQRVEQSGESESDNERIAQVYRHSDGYPASVLRDLVQLKDLLDATRQESAERSRPADTVPIDDADSDPGRLYGNLNKPRSLPDWIGDAYQTLVSLTPDQQTELSHDHV